MDSTDYAIRVFTTHVEKAGLTERLAGLTILEIGPGDSISTAIIAAAHGARTILVDAGRFVRMDISPYLELVTSLRSRGLRPPDLTGCRDLSDVLDRCESRYLTDGVRSLRTLKADSVDLVFSQAVLEHVRRHEFSDLLMELQRILKRGGVASHQVDLADHLGGGLNNLRLSSRVWESEFFARSGFYTNRIRFSEMRSLFERIGGECEFTHISRWDSLPTPKTALASEFRALSDDELRVSGFQVVLRKL